jgi:hypothetical protein
VVFEITSDCEVIAVTDFRPICSKLTMNVSAEPAGIRSDVGADRAYSERDGIDNWWPRQMLNLPAEMLGQMEVLQTRLESGPVFRAVLVRLPVRLVCPHENRFTVS